jgi:hypothetical protein
MLSLLRNGTAVIEKRLPASWAQLLNNFSVIGLAANLSPVLPQLDTIGVASLLPLHVHLYATAGAYMPKDFTGDVAALIDPKLRAKMRKSILGAANVTPNSSHFIREAPWMARDFWSLVAIDHNDVGGPSFQWAPWQLACASYSYVTHSAFSPATVMSRSSGWLNLVWLTLPPALTGETPSTRYTLINYGHHPANRTSGNYDTNADGNFDQVIQHYDLFLMYTDQNYMLSGTQTKHLFLPPVAMAPVAHNV